MLDFDLDNESVKWPRMFENFLHSVGNTAEPPQKTQGRSKPKVSTGDPKMKNIQFMGQGEDLEDDFNALGWLNPLPPQQGIPGWMRITFMKHFMDDLDSEEQDNLWAYEGVVLPGGRIILGRWWFCNENVTFNVSRHGSKID